jgi:uncharacterized protein YigA (DUF484 family)
MTKPVHYHGASTLITIKGYERSLEIQAEDIQRVRREAQAVFDAARENYHRVTENKLLDAKDQNEMRRNWQRVEDGISLLRREAAFWRVRAKKAESKLASEQASTNTDSDFSTLVLSKLAKIEAELTSKHERTYSASDAIRSMLGGT